MDSQVTLVEPRPLTGAILFLNEDNLKNTTIIQRGRPTEPLYTVETAPSKSNTTLIRREYDGSTVATIYRSTLFSDRIELGVSPPTKVGKWLRKTGKLGQTFPVAFEVNGEDFIWKLTERHQLRLYASDNTSKPIASFRSSRKRLVGAEVVYDPARIKLSARANAICDVVVASLFVVEPRARAIRARHRSLAYQMALNGAQYT